MTAVTHESFISRMLNGCMGSILGIVLFFLGVFLTIGNEGAYVSSKEVLEAAQAAAQDLKCEDSELPTDGTTLVFMQGCALTGLPEWSGNAFQLEGATGAWFETSLELYQWKETRHSESHKDSGGGGTTTVTWFSHEKAWLKTAQPSPTHPNQKGPDVLADQHSICDPAFGFDPNSPAHCNPTLPVAPMDGVEYAAEMTVQAGSVYINRDQMGMLKTKRAVQPTMLKTSLDAASSQLPITTLNTDNTRRQGTVVTSIPTGISARVGDVRVRWYTHAARSASVLGAVDADSKMVPWHSGVVAKVPGLSEFVNELQEGDVPRDAFFATLHTQIESRVWTLRVIALLMFCGGAFLFSRPLAIAPDVIPCVGSAIGGLVGYTLGVLSCAVGACTFLFITALCWLWFRPLVSLLLLVVAAAVGYGAIRCRRHARATKRLRHGAMLHNDHCGILPTHCCPAATNGYPMQTIGTLAGAQPMAPPISMHSSGLQLPIAQPVDPMPIAHVVSVTQGPEPYVPMGLPVEEGGGSLCSKSG